MRSILSVFFLSIFLSSWAQETAFFQPREYLSPAGDTLLYQIHFPEKYGQDNRHYPLVLFLHGAGERGRDNKAQLTYGDSLFVNSEYPAIVVFPQCPEEDFWSSLEATPRGTWDFPFTDTPRRPMALVMELLEQLRALERVDLDRQYVMGLSMGGFGTLDLLLRQPETFAAAVPICGGGNLHLARLYAPHTSLWLFHGADDRVVPPLYSRLLYRRLQQIGADVRYTEFDNTGHNSWDQAFAEPQLLPWLFSKSRESMAERRYQQPVFEEVVSRTFIYEETVDDTLGLDIYQAAGDAEKDRPFLLYVHGGGFAGGSRDEEGIRRFARQLARRGYVVGSMSYRLTMKGKSFHCDQPAPNKIRTFQLAVEDIRKATGFLIDHRDSLGIHPDRIVLAGSSAGAEAVLHAAYWRDKDLLKASPRLPERFRYAGVISMAGAIVDVELINRKTAIPTQLFHGTCDPLVPYATAPHHYCRKKDPGYLMLDGGQRIAEHLRLEGLPYFLVTACNGGHEWAGKPMAENVEDIVDFLYRDVMRGEFRQVHLVVEQPGECRLVNKPAFCR